MKLPPRWITVLGLLIAVSSIFLDPTTAPFLTTLLGAGASAKLAAFGALLAAIGRAIIPPATPTEP